jgi:hypothetical protein
MRFKSQFLLPDISLASTELAKLVAGKGDDQEKDRQKDRRRRSVVTDQPDANQGSCNRSDHSHDRFDSDGTHELCAHQHKNSKDRPVVMGQSQDLSAKQSNQTRETHFDPIA